MPRQLISGPTIGHLTLTAYTTIVSRMDRGHYGAAIRCGRVRYVDLAAVERFHGVTFTEHQLASAAQRGLDRVITVPDQEEEHEMV